MEQEQLEQINITLKKHEEKMSWIKSGSQAERIEHVLSEYRKLADNAVYEVRSYVEDVKSQFKALIIVLEGLTSEGMNHGQKRVIANHVITMLRDMVDKVDKARFEWDFSILERYDFFRTTTPEKRIYQKVSELKRANDRQESVLKTLKEVHPDIYKALTQSEEMPF